MTESSASAREVVASFQSLRKRNWSSAAALTCWRTDRASIEAGKAAGTVAKMVVWGYSNANCLASILDATIYLLIGSSTSGLTDRLMTLETPEAVFGISGEKSRHIQPN
jgi:hypothetical protein